MEASNECVIGNSKITIKQVVSACRVNGKLKLSSDPSFEAKIKKSRSVLIKKIEGGELIYGVNTGYGDSCEVEIPSELTELLPLQLTRYHQCGLGSNLSLEEARAVQIVRINSLAQGYSGVRWELLEHMVNLYNLGVVARIPCEGSVGASGDLTPLSYYAATLIGEGEVFYKGQCRPSREVYTELGLEPFILLEKEALALMNGTSVMTALACHALDQASYLAKFASSITALSSLALKGDKDHFDPKIFMAKPHEGTIQAASWIREKLPSENLNRKGERLQNRYSIRCAPHVIGVLVDGLSSFESLLETEINSANDNPLIDSEGERILHCGNFYGGHVAFTMDSLKVLVANIADLLDRQMALLVDTKFNNGLPMNLSGAQGERAVLYHGLKALQISASAWTAEALRNTTPASIFSRSTESHNQDKVSMGTIAARDALRVLELSQQVASASFLASLQAIRIRLRQGEIDLNNLSPGMLSILNLSDEKLDFIEEDRPLEPDLRNLMAMISEQQEVFA